MRNIILCLSAAILSAGALLALAPAAQAQTNVEFEEWEVPWGGGPRDPFVENSSSIWFVGQGGHYLGHLDVASGEFNKVDLPRGTGPHNTIVAGDGKVWFTGNRVGSIGYYDQASGEITEIDMPDAAARDPHTMVFDRAGDIWFTVQGGNFFGKLDTETHDIALIESKTRRSLPYGIKIAEDGIVWAVLLGTNKLARIDPATMEISEIELPRGGTRPRRIEITSDGRIWYVDYSGGYLGAYNPDTGAIEEWEVPGGGGAAPYGMAVDSEDRIWFVHRDGAPGQFTGFDSKTQNFIGSTQIPSFAGARGGTVRHMDYDQETGAVWFGTDRGTIGRAIVTSH
jgi:virginiamycin B lyase